MESVRLLMANTSAVPDGSTRSNRWVRHEYGTVIVDIDPGARFNLGYGPALRLAEELIAAVIEAIGEAF